MEHQTPKHTSLHKFKSAFVSPCLTLALFASQCQFAGVRAGKWQTVAMGGAGLLGADTESLTLHSQLSVRESQTRQILGSPVLSVSVLPPSLHGKLKFILDHQRKAMIIKWEFNVFVVNMKIFPEAY